MRILLDVDIPHEPFNTYVRQGTAGATIASIMEAIKPEAAYFTERNGRRSAILIVDLPNPSDVPRLAEPFFLKFNADCRLRIVMGPDDLAKAGLDAIGKRWG